MGFGNFKERWAPLVLALFLAINLVMTVKAVLLAGRLSPEWSLASWLFSYSGGFGRRGLIGELLLMMSDWTGLSIPTVVQAFQIALNITFLGLVFLLVRDRTPALWLILLLVSPATINNRWLDPTSSGQKELLFFVLLAAWALRLRAGPMKPVSLTAFAVAAALASLSHEMLLVTSPFFAGAYLLQQRREQSRFSWLTFTIMPASCLLASATVFLFGTDATAASCAALIDRGMSPTICSGYMNFPIGLTENIGITMRAASDLSFLFTNTYPLWAFLILIPCFVAWNRGDASKGGIREFVVVSVVCSVLLAPLYLAAVDWGRWLAIGATGTLILGAMIAPKSSAPANRPTRPAIYSTAISLCFVLLYASTWSLDRCCGATMPSLLSRLLSYNPIAG